MVLLPEGALGQTHLGVTPEESDLMNSLAAEVELVNNAIAVTTHTEHDPVTVETKVSMVALPSFERANEIVIVDTEAEPVDNENESAGGDDTTGEDETTGTEE